MLSSRLPRALRFRHARTHLAIAASLPSRSVATAGTSSHAGRHVYSYNCESYHTSSTSSTSLRGRSFGTAAALRKEANGGDKYYVATLPWSEKEEDRKERVNDLVKNARFAENENIAASSITTSKRASPIASSLKASLDHLNSTAQKGGGAWLLLRADTEEEAHDILIETNVGEVFDVEKATMQAVELDEMANEGAGPLYDGSESTDTSSNASSSSSSSSSSVFSSSSVHERDSNSNDEHLSGNVFDTDSTSESSKPTEKSRKKEKKESVNAGAGAGETGRSPTNASKKSTTYVGKKGKTGKGAKENAAVAEEARIGGHAVETSGPLYGK